MAGEMRNFDLDRLTKLSVIAGVSLISISIAYYLMLFVPQKERNRIEFLKQEQLVKKQKEQEIQKELELNKFYLDTCLKQTEELYPAQWAIECKAVAKVIEEGIKNCIENINNIERDVGLVPKVESNISFCKAKWGEPDYSADCRLPSLNAESINNQLRERKNECYKKYPLK